MYQASRSSHQYSCHRGPSAGGTKNSSSISSNSRVRNTKLPGVISFLNALPIWAIPNGGLRLVVVSDVEEVHEHALSRLGPQVGDRGVAFDRTDVGLEHEVERPSLGQVLGAAVGASVLDLVRAPPLLAVAAVDQGVGEGRQVARCLPDLGVREDRGVDRHDVVTLLDHCPPPGLAYVAEHEGAERAVVVGRADAAVDLGRREDEATPLAQVDDGVEQPGVGRGLGRCRHGGRLLARGTGLPPSVSVRVLVRLQPVPR